ncbi:hypothetical protein BDV41DRAFT_579335 [Aspergillus transmontanensis]|uniref:HNH nuclease domain-containing protein n=1 Tax=Aspergillus transmontanensis TaxID=1034304 RepID=A0A5N6VQA9_9EURO|nr:hypothetical protein BDV41DRAFT_579335 [Aspergillus transmontanensis]
MASIALELLSEERLHLIQRLSHAIGRKYIDSATHALLWLGDLESLRGMVETLESDSMFKSLVKLTMIHPELSMDALKAWPACSSRKNEPTETIYAPVASPTTSRKRKSTGESRSPSERQWSQAARDTAEKRDNGCCAITKMGEPIQVCHIYPFALGNEAKWQKEKLWTILESFWAPVTVDRWKKNIIGPDAQRYLKTYCASQLLCKISGARHAWPLNPLRCLRTRHHLQCVSGSYLVELTRRRWIYVTDEELDEYSEGFSDDGDMVTLEESSDDDDDDDDDDGFAHLDY